MDTPIQPAAGGQTAHSPATRGTVFNNKKMTLRPALRHAQHKQAGWKATRVWSHVCEMPRQQILKRWAGAAAARAGAESGNEWLSGCRLFFSGREKALMDDGDGCTRL